VGTLAVAEAYNDVVGGITNAASHMGVLNASIALAKAGQADLGTAANGLVKVMNSYGFSALDTAGATQKAAFVTDVFSQTVGMGVGSMDAFVASMAPIAGIASSVGVGFDELGAAMAFMTAEGPEVAVAATQIKAAITSLLNPNETMAKALASVGITSGSSMLKEYGLAESLNMVKQAVGSSQDAMARALGSTEALTAAIYLTKNNYDAFVSSFAEGAVGITDDARQIQLESFESKMARLEAASTSVKLRLGDDINNIKGYFTDMGIGFWQGVVLFLIHLWAG
jgi:TP901 family phage tail tape measure protein